VVKLAPNDAEAHFGHGTNMARWGQTKGVMRALFLLPIVKREIKIVLRELEAVLGEKVPTNLADWTMKDSRRARELLESIKGKL
jgi:hypothetical protein